MVIILLFSIIILVKEKPLSQTISPQEVKKITSTLPQKKEEVKKIDAPKDTGNEKEKFIENLKVTTTYKRPRKKAETLICNGNGLGIQSEVKF